MEASDIKRPRLVDTGLRSDLKDEEILEAVKAAWASSSDKLVKSDIEIIRNPFKVCVIRNFVTDPDLLTSAVEELKDVVFNEKSNDLYEFKQSDDVRNLTNFSFIPQLYDIIRREGRQWVNDVVGGPKLNEEISATFSSYEYKDRLLCHDDKCEDRHIAFILYLVENWREEDGGLLELFDTDSLGYPSQVIKSLCPEFNTMIFFEVNDHSFHQVTEVKSKTKKRLSLNGWFHSSGKKLEGVSSKMLIPKQITANCKTFNLEDYFLSTYFDNSNKTQIKNIFTSESEIQLDDFIAPEFLKKIVNELRGEEIKWMLKGPANMRKYEMADPTCLPSCLNTLQNIFQSKCWFQYLKSITALDLHPSVTSDLEIWQKGMLPVCNFEVQRWTRSCYTLIHDKDPEFHSEALDLVLRIPFQEDENSEYEENDTPEAGHIIYIDSTSGDEECLLHIGFKMNSLGLIFRDDKTLRFTRYLDSTCRPFYQMHCTYRPWKPPEDDQNAKHCQEDEESEDSLSDESK